MSKKDSKHQRGHGEERREHKRIKKSFILSYYDKDDPETKHEITQVRNISMGGICFITTQEFEPLRELGIELKTPFLSDVTHIDGTVQESHANVDGLLYETRLKFNMLKPEAEILLSQLIEFFSNDGEYDKDA